MCEQSGTQNYSVQHVTILAQREQYTRGRNSGSPRTTRKLVRLPKMMTAVVQQTTTKFENIFKMLCLSCYFAYIWAI